MGIRVSRDDDMPRPASFIGGALTAIGIFGVVISIVQLTDSYWWFLFAYQLWLKCDFRE